MNPWEAEPNVLRFNSHGLKCIIIRHTRHGHLCGYVRLPHGKLRNKVVRKRNGTARFFNRYTRQNGYDVVDDIEVHGGLTFCGRLSHYRAKSGIWLGFDCAHYGDFMPGLHVELKKIRMHIPEFPLPELKGTYKTIEYVRQETEKLAEQIATLSR